MGDLFECHSLPCPSLFILIYYGRSPLISKEKTVWRGGRLVSFGIALDVTSEKSAQNSIDVFHFSVFYWVLLVQFQHLVRVTQFFKVNWCKNTFKYNEISIFSSQRRAPVNQINHVWGGTTGYFWCCCFYFITFSQLDLNHSGIAMHAKRAEYIPYCAFSWHQKLNS